MVDDDLFVDPFYSFTNKSHSWIFLCYYLKHAQNNKYCK